MEVSMMIPQHTSGPPPFIIRVPPPVIHEPAPPSPIPERHGKRSRHELSDSESDLPPSRVSRPSDSYPTRMVVENDNHGEGPSRLQGLRIKLRIPLLGGGRPPKSLPRDKDSRRSQRSHTVPLEDPETPAPKGKHRRPKSNLSRGKPRTRAQARRSSVQSETSLEAINAESTAVKREIGRLGLGLRDVTGDGNCLFRALADQLWGEGGRHGEVRRVVCDYLEAHRKGKAGGEGDGMEGFVVPFLQDGEDYEGYVKRMRQPQQFGSHIEIQAAARVFRRNIRVVMSSTSFTIVWGDESAPPGQPEAPAHHATTPKPSSRSGTPPGPLMEPLTDMTTLTGSEPLPTEDRPRPRTRASTQTLPLVPIYPPDQSMLWLALFSQAEHFQSVRRMSEVTGKIEGTGPAEVEDFRMIPHELDLSEAAKRERGEVIPENQAPSVAASDNVRRLLASLPAGHDVSATKAAGVLRRVKGDLGEAVEILLEELDIERQSSDETTSVAETEGSDRHVEKLLAEPALSETTYRDRPSSPESASPSETVVSNPSTSSVSLPESTSSNRHSGMSTPSTSTSESERKDPILKANLSRPYKSAPSTPRKDLPRELRAIENFLGAGKKETPVLDTPEGSRSLRTRTVGKAAL